MSAHIAKAPFARRPYFGSLADSLSQAEVAHDNLHTAWRRRCRQGGTLWVRNLAVSPQYAAWMIVVSELKEQAPHPHLLDFDWRFCDATIDTFVALLSQHGRILFLGTPFLFERFSAHEDCYLIDQNPAYKQLLRSAAHRIRSGGIQEINSLPIDFHAIVMDPPWHTECYGEWINHCSRFLVPGGEIYFVLFPEATRPNAALERASLINALTQHGTLSFTNLQAFYDTPPFEAYSAEAAGHNFFPGRRYGELWRITITSKPAQTYQLSESCADANEWLRFTRRRSTIMVRAGIDNTTHLSFGSVYGFSESTSFTLKSVSRRHAAREQIDILTERNRAAKLSAPQEIYDLLQMWSDGAPIKSAARSVFKSSSDAAAACKLADALQLEVE